MSVSLLFSSQKFQLIFLFVIRERFRTNENLVNKFHKIEKEVNLNNINLKERERERDQNAFRIKCNN